MIANHYITIAFDARSKSHKVADYAVMLDIGIEIGVKVTTDLYVGSQCNEWRENCTFGYGHLIHDDHILSARREKGDARFLTLGIELGAHSTICDRDADRSLLRHVCEKSLPIEAGMAVDLGRAVSVVDKDCLRHAIQTAGYYRHNASPRP